MTNMTCTTESTISRLSAAMASLTTAVETALVAPAPKACTMRMATSIQMSNARAHSALAATYVTTPATSTGLRPKRSLTGPNSKSPTAKNR